MNNQDNTFNGWTNFETWQAALWLDNDGFIEILREEDNITFEGVERMLEVMTFERLEACSSSLLSDIVGAWMREVNIQEIVDNEDED
jgi:hypothetical protein